MAESADLPLTDRTLGRLLADQAARQGERRYLRFDDRTWSYAEVERLTNRLANGLLAFGVQRGDHVAYLVDNRPEFLWLFYAAAKIGAVSVPVSTAAKGELLVYYLTQSQSTVLVLEASQADRFMSVQAQCPAIARAVLLGDDGPPPADLAGRLGLPTTDEATLLQGAETPPAAEVHFNDTCCLLYTSGTTGPSKGNVMPQAMVVSMSYVLAHGLGYRSDDVLYTALPLFHGNALLTTCTVALACGASVALSRRFSASNFWSDVKRYGATQFNLLGAMSNFLWGQPPSPADRDHSVRLAMVVPVPSFAKEFEARFGIRIVSLYALTDYGTGSVLGPDDPPAKLWSAGRPPPHMQVAILDDDDLALPAGEVGEICLRNDLPFASTQGYFDKPEATAESRRNLWFHTGDRGYLDADGYLYFVDRKKDAMRRRGHNISSFEVEQILLKHPAIQEVAAYAVESEYSEDEVMVSVICRPGQTIEPAELVHFAKDNMIYYMVPRYVEIVTEMPLTMSGKVEKYKLRARAEADLSAVWDRERAGIVVTR